jgi:hypothetical protein
MGILPMRLRRRRKKKEKKKRRRKNNFSKSRLQTPFGLNKKGKRV